MREIVAVPGRVEGDVVEIADLFVQRGGELVRADGCPPHRERFERAGYDLPGAARPGAGVTGVALVGLLLRAPGCSCIWWSFWVRAADRATAQPDRPRCVPACATTLVQAGIAGGDTAHAARRLLGGVPARLPASCMPSSASRPIALCFALMAAWGPVRLVRMRARQRRSRLRDLWPEAVDNLTSAVRAGHVAAGGAVPARRRAGRRSCAGRSRRSREDYRATGRFHDCLDRLKERLSDPVGDRLVESLRMAREVGGSDLGRLLRTLSAFLREDARTRAELETRQGWTVNAARLAVAAPWIVLAMLSTRPEAVAGVRQRHGAVVLPRRRGRHRRRLLADGAHRPAARGRAGAAMTTSRGRAPCSGCSRARPAARLARPAAAPPAGPRRPARCPTSGTRPDPRSLLDERPPRRWRSSATLFAPLVARARRATSSG